MISSMTLEQARASRLRFEEIAQHARSKVAVIAERYRLAVSRGDGALAADLASGLDLWSRLIDQTELGMRAFALIEGAAAADDPAEATAARATAMEMLVAVRRPAANTTTHH